MSFEKHQRIVFLKNFRRFLSTFICAFVLAKRFEATKIQSNQNNGLVAIQFQMFSEIFGKILNLSVFGLNSERFSYKKVAFKY